MGAEDGTPITVGQSSGSYAKQYTYDLAGNRTSLQVSTDSTVQNISYTYDGLNCLIQEAETGALTQGYTYDARGNRASMTASGKERYTVSYAYDANNRLLTERIVCLYDLTAFIILVFRCKGKIF